MFIGAIGCLGANYFHPTQPSPKNRGGSSGNDYTPIDLWSQVSNSRSHLSSRGQLQEAAAIEYDPSLSVERLVRSGAQLVEQP